MLLNFHLLIITTDLKNSAPDNETFMKKLNRARFAVARTSNIRSMAASLAAKYPYQRAFSAPGSLLYRATSKGLLHVAVLVFRGTYLEGEYFIIFAA